MALVDLDIGGRKFQLACGDGEESRLAGLAEALNNRINELKLDQEGSSQLLLAMTALMMQDELNELGKKTFPGREGKPEVNSQYLKPAAEKINLIAEYMETLAGKLEKC